MNLLLLAVILLLLFAGGVLAMPQISKTHPIHQWDLFVQEFAHLRDNLRPEEIKAIIMIESSGNPRAINPSDPSWGLMQVTPMIGKAYAQIQDNQELFEPRTNLRAGSGFLSNLKSKYEKRFPLGVGHGWVQMYNLGEPKFLAGSRNRAYEDKFLSLRNFFQKDFLEANK